MANQVRQGPIVSKPKSRKSIIIIAIIVIISLCCIISLIIGLIRNSTLEGKATLTARAEIQQIIQIEKSHPTSTSIPSEIPEPSKTPKITNTPKSTYTPRPTITRVPIKPPTFTPAPVIFTGTGDSIIDYDNSVPSLVHIIGNASSRYFSVTNYDVNNEYIDLLVNTTDPYDGICPLDFKDSEHTTRFQVSAEGAWTIEILPLSSMELLFIPGEISGKGDYIFTIRGGTPDIATITGNSSSRYFGVYGYSDNGLDLLVNTTDPYAGMVLLDSTTIVIEVNAHGEWAINITTR